MKKTRERRINLCAMVIVTLVLLCNMCLGEINYYVTSDGSDSNSGTIASPFATIEKAREAVRASRPDAININGATAVTLAVWVKPDVKNNWAGIISCKGNSFFALQFSGHGSGSPVEFRAMGAQLVGPDNSCPTKRWSHVAGVWQSGKTQKLYINGVEVASHASPRSGEVNAIGWYAGTDRFMRNRYLEGQTKQLVVYDRALSASEISGLAAATPVIPSDHKLRLSDKTTYDKSIGITLGLPPMKERVNIWVRTERTNDNGILEFNFYDSRGADPIAYSDYRYQKNRIAYTADGNYGDTDDFGASPAALALIAKAKLQDKLVHFDYNNHLGQSHAHMEKQMRLGISGAIQRWNYDKSVFFDDRVDLDGAVANLTQQINLSSKGDPLFIILAGPCEVVYRAVVNADPNRRKHIFLLSHSGYNDHYKVPIDRPHTIDNLVMLGCNYKRIKDQNGSSSPDRLLDSRSEWSVWDWMKDHRDPDLQWLYTRVQSVGRGDISDSGMVYYLLTGDQDTSPSKYQHYFVHGIN